MEKTEINGVEVEFATKEEAFWLKLRENAEKRVEGYEESIKIDKAWIETCERKMKESK